MGYFRIVPLALAANLREVLQAPAGSLAIVPARELCSVAAKAVGQIGNLSYILQILLAISVINSYVRDSNKLIPSNFEIK